MAKRFLVVAGLFLSLLMASTPLVAAQSEPDVAAIGDTVLGLDATALIDALQTPMRNRDLPKGFSDAKAVDITNAKAVKAADCVYDASDLSAEGATAYSLVSDDAALGFSNTCASINYVIFREKDLGRDPLGDFKKGIEGSLEEGTGTPDSNNGISYVTDTTVAGTDAVLFTYIVDGGSLYVGVQVLTVVVGNVLVVTQITTQSDTEIAPEDLEGISDELSIAGIDHLGTVADNVK